MSSIKLIDFENHFYDHCTIDAMAVRNGYPKYDRKNDIIEWDSQITLTSA